MSWIVRRSCPDCGRTYTHQNDQASDCPLCLRNRSTTKPKLSASSKKMVKDAAKKTKLNPVDHMIQVKRRRRG